MLIKLEMYACAASHTHKTCDIKGHVLYITPEEVGQALVWLICACVGKLRNAIIFFQEGQANFKQPLLGSVKVREVF